MTQLDLLFLHIIQSGLQQESYDLPAGIPSADIEKLLYKADYHSVLPFVYETIMQSMVDLSISSEKIEKYRREAVKTVMLQIEKTSRFLQLYKIVLSSNLRPLVVKGLFCRHLYDKPSYRASVDEDILVTPQDFSKLNRIFLNEGFQYPEEYQDIFSEFEVSYIRNPEYYEIHKYLFDPADEAFKSFNKYFENYHLHTVTFNVDDVELLTLDYTRHMLFLILHVFKHFLFSGFGIRQICDITLLANTYGQDIDWDYVVESSKELHAYEFMCSIFKISEKYLILDRIKSAIPHEILDNDINEEFLLEDVLNAGIMGGKDINRLHSSNITLHAVRDKTRSKHQNTNISLNNKGLKYLFGKAARVKTVLFPSREYLRKRYPYLDKTPILLPIAWGQRVLSYLRDMRTYKQDNPLKALEIGEVRTELLRKYHII